MGSTPPARLSPHTPRVLLLVAAYAGRSAAGLMPVRAAQRPPVPTGPGDTTPDSCCSNIPPPATTARTRRRRGRAVEPKGSGAALEPQGFQEVIPLGRT